MANRITNNANFFEAELTAEMSATATVAQMSTTDGLVSPAYLVIEPEEPTRREVIYFDGPFTTSSVSTTSATNRYQSGSAAGSGIVHPSGSAVWSVPLAQHVDDLNDRVNAHTHAGGSTGATVNHGDLLGVGANDHHDRDHASRHDIGGDDAIAGWHEEAEGFAEVASVNFTSGGATVATVNLEIPATWSEWSCWAIANWTVDKEFRTHARIVIDGTNGTLQEINQDSTTGNPSSPGVVQHRRTGITSTGTRAVTLYLEADESNANVVVGTLYARAVRTA